MRHSTIHEFLMNNLGDMLFARHRNWLFFTLEFNLQEKFNLEFLKDDE